MNKQFRRVFKTGQIRTEAALDYADYVATMTKTHVKEEVLRKIIKKLNAKQSVQAKLLAAVL